MSMSRIKYFFNQAKKNIFRNGLMSVASLFTIISCLVILGIFMIISLNVGHVTEQIKDQCEIQVYMYTNTSQERVAAIESEILAVDNVKSVELYTKEQGLEDLKTTTYAEYPELLEGFGPEDNPLPDSYMIVLDDITRSGETAEELRKIKDVEEVTNKQDFVNTVISISDTIQKVTLVIMLLLFLVAVVIISNTVRLTVFNRKKEIGIMKYIGATDRFIRMPFIFEGVMIGFFGAVISYVLMCGCYAFLLKYISISEFTFFTIVNMKPVAIWLGVVFTIVGSFIGMIGSMISMRKYLKV